MYFHLIFEIHDSISLKYGQSEIKECLVNQRPPDSVDVLQGAEPDLLQYVGPVLLLQGEGDHGLLHLRLDLLSLGDLLQELTASEEKEGSLSKINQIKRQ